ncbi:hypothetical protein [Aureimonas leprariae]|uniref:hypothetical protein n=1 Tax=Plantimonas leprariae TaxID=2615207 RepID=UPI00138723DC|nr:hypothetical protein [Aureimonas leprariae]
MGTLENRVAKLERVSGTDLPQYGRVFLCIGAWGTKTRTGPNNSPRWAWCSVPMIS